ncbi:MAG: S1 family peptidase [Mycobacterium sp.]
MTGAATLFAGTASANPMPGMEVSDENSSCTAGFAAQGGDGQYYLLTSGHCDQGDGSQWSDAGDAPLGRIVASENNGDDHDAAMLLLDPLVGVPNGNVDGRYRVRDVLTVFEIRVGMPFCKVGARTGETCGTVTAVQPNLVTTNLFSLEGDSGSPGFVMNSDGTVSAVGILQGGPDGDDNTTDFILVGPLLRQWGLRILP